LYTALELLIAWPRFVKLLFCVFPFGYSPVCLLLFVVGLFITWVAGSGWLVRASLLVVAGLHVHVKLVQLWVRYGTWIGEGFLACWVFVWPGEVLSPKYRLYAPLFYIGFLQVCFGCPFLGLLWRLLPLCSLCWCHGFHQFGWGSLPNCLGYWCSVLCRSSTSMMFRLKEIGGSFLL
jgi:hypothetical protein